MGLYMLSHIASKLTTFGKDFHFVAGVETVRASAGLPQVKTRKHFCKLSKIYILYTCLKCSVHCELCSFPSSGHFGQVRQVREQATGTCWAGKFLKIRKLAGSRLGVDRSIVEHEVEILQALHHPNIVTLKDVFESRAEVVLILELWVDVFLIKTWWSSRT